MTLKNQIYKCKICGNIVEVIHRGNGELICCGQPMDLLEEKNEEGNEKHIPVLENTNTGIKVKIGSVQHPMEENHYIEWIEVITEDRVYKRFLNPGNEAEAEFNIKMEEIKEVRAYCNIHGLWKS